MFSTANSIVLFKKFKSYDFIPPFISHFDVEKQSFNFVLSHWETRSLIMNEWPWPKHAPDFPQKKK